jgi:DNA-binding response OmpR family regulator
MKKILIVEDNHEVRENIAEILMLTGYEVIQAQNGKEGVSSVIKERPDLVLCDVMMPELDGFGVLRVMNNHPELMDIPFIFLTAKAEKDDFRKGMGLGADDYITKPFDHTELIDAVEMRLRKSDRIRTSFDRTEAGLRRFYSEAKAIEELSALSEERELRKYQSKDMVYEEGQNARWLFFIISGKVKCYKINDFGKELITNIYSEGDFFGYHTLVREEVYVDNAMALEETHVRLIPKNDFTMLLYNNRDFSAQFIKMLANQAQESEEMLLSMAYSSVRKKVANALVKYAEKNSADQNEETPLIRASREDLASLAGTAKETLIRTLSDFKSEGIIEVSSSGIRILDTSKLRNMPD